MQRNSSGHGSPADEFGGEFPDKRNSKKSIHYYTVLEKVFNGFSLCVELIPRLHSSGRCSLKHLEVRYLKQIHAHGR